MFVDRRKAFATAFELAEPGNLGESWGLVESLGCEECREIFESCGLRPDSLGWTRCDDLRNVSNRVKWLVLRRYSLSATAIMV